MSGITEEYIGAILRKTASVMNLQDWSYTQVKFTSLAQNYFGIIIPVVLSGKRDGVEVQIKLVLKLAPTDERFRVTGAVTIMFAREVYVYSVVLKRYQAIQRLFPVLSQYVIPQCYYVQKEYCKEAIALQDMCGDGYRPYTHEMFLDLEHTLISLKSLAKLHALSYILKNKKPYLYSEISQTCIPLTEHSNLRYMDIVKDRLDKAIKKFQSTEYVPLLQKLKHNCGKFYDAAVHSVQSTCICHGDIWKENILFKYDENNKPVSACIIDYQTTRICSPAFDTMYLIISSTNTEVRRKYLQQLLDIYYQTFEKVLKEVGLDAEEIYSKQMFDSDVKVVAPACFITANTALWLLNGLQEEGHVRSKIVWNTKEEKEQAVNKYKEIMKAIIDDLTSQGYLIFSDT